VARLLLGVSGGIAAYKALEAARLAVKRGHAVRVIQTPASERFVGRASFEAITGAPVLMSEFEPDPARGAYPGEPVPERSPISHLALVERAEAFLIAPATANTLAKLAHGHADNLLTAAALAAACPIAVAPAMNNRMYVNPATRTNLEVLQARGITVIGPTEGLLASHGEQGIGRLAEPDELIDACESLLAGVGGNGFNGVRVLVTAGGTREPIDSVRFLGNRSSGRMGLALAREAARRGADVTLIAANVGLEPPGNARVITVHTAAELAQACRTELPACDVLLMSAAVADFRPVAPAGGKLKKDQGIPKLELEPTEDILSEVAGRRREGQVIVGFAAEHGDDAVELARGKLARKQLDAIVVNDISRAGIGFEADDNEVTILTAAGVERHVPRSRKERVARAVLDEVERLRAARGGHRTDGTRADTRSPARV
jgi:phosphopantothenoylcysteine decarboxylase / phosphopantothenate---cysteine ligase